MSQTVERLSPAAARLRGRLVSLLSREGLPGYDGFIASCNEASSVLEAEPPSYRPAGSSGGPGGLLDFTAGASGGIPAVVVPDVHGRGRLLLDVLDFRPPFAGGRSVLSLLDEGRVLVVCLGDLPHAEARGRRRWAEAYADFRSFYYDGGAAEAFTGSPHMAAEMAENFAVWESVFLLKTAFPANFHVLKGNHDNVRNASFAEGVNEEFGNRAFRKFCEEGLMCAEFIRNRYDDLLLHCLGCFERSLPVCAAFGLCVASHAEPARPFTRAELVGALTSDVAVAGLTWTANGEAEEGSVERTVASLFGRGLFRRPPRGVRWIGGHRPVRGRYALRQGGRFVQIHDPDAEQVAVVEGGRAFDPETDVFPVGPA